MLLGRRHLSGPAQAAIDDAEDNLLVSAVTFDEIKQTVRLGRWDEMTPHAEGLISHFHLSPSQILPLVSADQQFDGIVTRIW